MQVILALNSYSICMGMNFKNRLADLMADTGNMSTSDLAKATGIPNSMISRWLLYDMDLELKSLVTLADFFQCSLDFLIGKTEETNVTLAEQRVSFASRFAELKQEKGLTNYRIHKQTGLSEQSLSKWARGVTPMVSALIKLAEVFDCSVDYLVGRSCLH